MNDHKVSIKVLLADDDRIIHNLLGYHLAQAGMELKSVYNGCDALEVAKADAPDLLILDVMLPGLDGFKVLEKWAEHESLRAIPVIMLTVWSEGEDKLNAIRDGASAYFTKPFNPSELVDKIRALTQTGS